VLVHAMCLGACAACAAQADAGLCCRAERSAAHDFAPEEARMTQTEIEAGLAARASCLPLLRAWLAHEAVRQSAADDND
jgi:hypothetical protein